VFKIGQLPIRSLTQQLAKHKEWPHFLWDKTWSLSPVILPVVIILHQWLTCDLLSAKMSAHAKNTKMADITPPSTAHVNLSCTRQLSNSTVIWRNDEIFLFMQYTRTRNKLECYSVRSFWSPSLLPANCRTLIA